MIDNKRLIQITEDRYYKFIKDVSTTDLIWGFKNSLGEWATANSDDFNNEDTILFWSDKDDAKTQSKDIFEEFTLESTTLSQIFEDNVLNNMLIGVNLIKYDGDNFFGTAMNVSKIAGDIL